MRKFLITMMCIIMVVCFMPTVAMAEETPVAFVDANGNSIQDEGETAYTSLATAVANANSGDTVFMLSNVYLTETVRIESNQNVILDLAGKAITVQKTGERSLYAIDNYGIFTLRDSVGNGSITARGTENFGTMYIQGGTIDSCDSNGGGASVWNEGVLFVSGGTLKTSGGIYNKNAATAINNYGGELTVDDGKFDCTYHAIFNSNGGTAVINGGTYDVSGTDYAYAISNNEGCEMTISNVIVRSNCGAIAANTGKMTINSGSFWGGKYYGVWVTNDGTHTDLTINGGTFYGKKYGIYADVDDGGQDVSDVHIAINGGSFGGNEAAAIGERFSNNTWALNIYGGYFTSNPSTYVEDGYIAVASDKAGYSYMITEKIADAADNVEPIKGTNDVPETDNLPVGIPDDKEGEVVIAAGNTDVSQLAAIAGTEASKITTEQADLLKGQLTVPITESDTVTLYVQTFLDVMPTVLNDTLYTIDITPKMQIIASTAGNAEDIALEDGVGVTKNADIVQAAKAIQVTTPVTVSIQLPASFASDLGSDSLFVQHKKGIKTYIYNATVSGDSTKVVTFDNPHGFSEFTITKEAPVAKIGEIGYASLQAAVDDVKYGETIVLQDNDASNIIVSKAVTFTLDAIAGKSFTGTVVAGSGYNLAKSGNTYTVTAITYSGGGTVTTPLEKAKIEASKAVENYVKQADYDTEEQAEIKAIADKAKADIKTAKTEAEVKAIEVAAKAEIDKLETAEEKELIRTVEATKFKARSKATTLSEKKAIRVTWNVPEGMEFDGFEVYRSTERYKGFGTEPIFTTQNQKYTNNKGLEVGKTYYYKVRAFKYVNDEKAYTEYSYKAIRTVK